MIYCCIKSFLTSTEKLFERIDGQKEWWKNIQRMAKKGPSIGNKNTTQSNHFSTKKLHQNIPLETIQKIDGIVKERRWKYINMDNYDKLFSILMTRIDENIRSNKPSDASSLSNHCFWWWIKGDISFQGNENNAVYVN